MNDHNIRPSDAPAPHAPSVSRRRHGLLRGLMGALLALMLGLAALWVWSGSEGSLASALRGVAILLPQGQSLSAQGVQGRLRTSGLQRAQIEQLVYTADGLRVQAEHISLSLDTALLWQGRLPLTQLQVAQLQVQDHRSPTSRKPPAHGQLPLEVQLDWQMGRLDWQGATAVVLDQLQGSYAYAAQMHSFKLAPFEFAQGRYSGQASLQAVQPMALRVALDGQIQMPQTGRLPSWPVDAKFLLQGELGALDAALQLSAHLTPRTQPQAPAASLMQADVSALIRPWQSEVVTHAQGQWRNLDLAWLWPGAPTTGLDGELAPSPGSPDGAWNLQARNRRAGPWDRQQLPLQDIQARVSRQDGLWQVQDVLAHIGAGRVQGQANETAQGWVGQLQLEQVQPAQLISALQGPAWRGQIQAQALPNGALDVQANLSGQASASSDKTGAAASALAPGEAAQLVFQGQWQAGAWAVQRLNLRLADAVLTGQGRLQTAGPVLQGEFQMAWPGLQLQLSGEAAPTRGQGQMHLAVQDAARAQAWLQRWPGGASVWREGQWGGQADITAHWQGGWQRPDTQLTLDGTSSGLQFQTDRQAVPIKLSQAQTQVRGTLAALQTQWQAKLQQGPWAGQVNARMALATPWGRTAQGGAAGWQGQVQALDAEVKKAAQPSGWHAQLTQAWGWRTTPTLRGSVFSWEAGAVQWQGPTPGAARVQWSGGQWPAPASGGLAAALQLQVDDVPLSWAQALGAPEWPGDVMLRGRVDVQSSQPLTLTAVLERSRGDLLLPLEGAGQTVVPAGLREAQARLRIAGREAKLDVSWNSEQLGQLSAQAQTQLTDHGEWLASAPISGHVQSSLQRVGAWSWLAPPGWRVKGTLDAAIDLSGTRSQPRWQGTLAADQLTVRSAVQGVEFNQGQLRAKLQDQQVELTQLSFKGEGAQGGHLQAQGRLQWLQSATDAPNFQQVRVAVTVQAQKLRVSNRADRRLTLSGAVDAQLDQGQFKIKGRVQADQALFVLPDNTTPTLGDDVVVRRGGARSSAASGPGGTPSPTHAQGVAPTLPTPSWLGVPEVQLALDLGPDFQVQGQGVQTRLTGVLNLSSSAATRGALRLNGDVRTEGGRYRAYGQDLTIESGLLRFNGPFNNPDLDILAIRPNLSQRVGVTLGGTALQPRIQLYADPDLPEAEKLAWLVLGRSGADGGAESALLQQAAVALLSRDGKGVGTQLAGALGLDEVSLSRGSRGDSTASGAAISLGKRVSRDFYLVYESSLSGTFGSLYMFYDLTRRFKLRAQTGDQNALDLIFTVRKD